MKPEEQCPTCHFNTYARICGRGRPRINQDAGGTFYKTLPCPLWTPKRAPMVNLEVCPTCGQKLPKVISGAIGSIERISELVEIEKRAQMTMPGIIPEDAPISELPAKRIPRRSSGSKRVRKPKQGVQNG